jgi:hypothetical protein
MYLSNSANSFTKAHLLLEEVRIMPWNLLTQ